MSNIEATSLSTYERWDGEYPGDHQFSTLENFNYQADNRGHDMLRRVADRLMDWDGNQFAGVLLHGQPGTGKSHAAIGLARALHDNGADIHYRFVPELHAHTQGVSEWTAPRILEPHFGASRPATISESYTEDRDGKEVTVSRSYMEEAGTTELVKRNANSVFPSYYAEGLDRNPKTVLVLDDYKPQWRPHIRTAIEAAANFGGLIIMTSNFNNIFQLTDLTEREIVPPHMQVVYGAPDEVRQAQEAAIRREAETLRSAFASRLVAGFVEIELTGIDHRKQNSFWTDMLDPRDFS